MGDLDFEKRDILAIDLKSFYASVECIDRGLDPFRTPLIVCDPDRGDGSIVMAVTPFLKKKGVPSRCRRRDVPEVPNLIVAVPRMARYLEISARINDIYLRHVDEADLHVYSVDESFLDVTDFLWAAGTDAVGLARRIIAEVKRETGLTVCAGVGQNMFLAKVAMDIEAKHNPDFLARWTIDDVPAKLWSVSPLSEMWGIGSRMESRLNAMGFFKVGDIAQEDPQVLISEFGVVGGELWLHSHGVDRAIIARKQERAPASLSVGQQLHLPARGAQIHLLGREMGRELAIRLAQKHLAASTLTAWMGGDETWAGTIHLDRPIVTSHELERAVEQILRRRGVPKEIYSIGLVAGQLSSAEALQLDLMTDWQARRKDEELDATLAQVRAAFGPTAITRASALLRGSTSLKRAEQIGGHKA